MNLYDKDKKYIGRDCPAVNLDVVRSESGYLYNSQGKKYIDFLMGWCVGNIGWGNKTIQKKIKNFTGPTYIRPNYLYKPWVDLAELLAKITPGRLQKTFRATGGTEAVEIALQAAMSHTKRYKFISIEGSYHGHSIGAMSVGMSDFRKKYKNLLNHCYKIKLPLDGKAIQKIEQLLKRRDIAAFIMEPIICNLGVIIPKREFMEKLQNLCKKYKTLLIIDEVATGFGRTGKLFASEHYNLKPDIMCLSKGLSGGYGAIGATIMTPEVAKSMEYNFSFYSTYGWHPLNVAAAIANVEYIMKNKDKLLKNIEIMSEYFEFRLKKMDFKYPAEIRIKGLAIGVEFNNESYAKQIVDRSQRKGLLFSRAGTKILTFFPHLNINKKVAKESLDILEKSIG